MPATAFSCESCSKAFRVISTQAGRKVRCPHCGSVTDIPPTIFREPASQVPPDDAGAISDVAIQSILAKAASQVPPDDADAIATDDPVTHDFSAVSEQDKPDALGAVAAAVRQTKRRMGNRSPHQRRMAHSHSALAKTASIVAKALLIVAVVVEVYILFTTEWGEIADLPMKLALPAYALTLIPASTIAVTGVFLLTAAHCTEYLARIAASTELR